MEQIKSGLKLLRSAERGITSDGQRIVSPKTAELFREIGTREINEALDEAEKNNSPLPEEAVLKALSLMI